jgi:hypothetical protein
MARLIALVPAIAATLMLAAVASAGAPDRFTFTDHYSYVANDCGFSVSVEGVFTNMVIDGSAATGTGTLELHQSDVATASAKGVTLRVNDHYTILVRFVDGVPVEATHVGVLDNITGPTGEHIFFRTGLAAYEVVFDPDLGYYVDGPLISRHGIRDDFDLAEFCASFG